MKPISIIINSTPPLSQSGVCTVAAYRGRKPRLWSTSEKHLSSDVEVECSVLVVEQADGRVLAAVGFTVKLLAGHVLLLIVREASYFLTQLGPDPWLPTHCSSAFGYLFLNII